MRLLLLITLLVSAGAARAAAGVPSQMNYQGRLLNTVGVPVPDGSGNTVVFRIYNVASAGSDLWNETHVGVTTSAGLFSVVLGSVSAIPLPFNEDYWLGIEVNGNGEMNPRQKLTTAPYAFRAKYAEIAAVAAPLSLTHGAGESTLSAFNSGGGNGAYINSTTGKGTETRGSTIGVSATASGASGIGGHFQAVTGVVIAGSVTGLSVTSSFAGGTQGNAVYARMNNAFNAVILGYNDGAGIGAAGQTAGGGTGVYGYAPNGTGVYGYGGSPVKYGVEGYNAAAGGTGVLGRNDSATGAGVWAHNLAGGMALKVSGNARFDGTSNTTTFNTYVSFTAGTNLAAGGVTAPLTLSQTASTPSLNAINWGGGHAVDALANSDNAAALRGRNMATSGYPIAVIGESSGTGNGIGVLGTTDPFASTPIFGNEIGVYGYSSGQIAVYGRNSGAGGFRVSVMGVNSSSTNTGAGVIGENNSPFGVGIHGYNQAGTGVPVGIHGEVTSGSVTGGAAVMGEFLGVPGPTNMGFGVFGVNKATNNAGAGVFGDSNSPYGAGIYARNLNVGPALVASGYSVAVSATADPFNGLGVYATGQTGVAAVSGVLPIYALNTAGGGFITAIRAEVQGTNTGVQALNTMGGNMGSLAGPVDIAHFAMGVGVQGLASPGGGIGVHGISDNGSGVKGETSNIGVGASGPVGVKAVNTGSSASGNPASALDIDGGITINSGRADPAAGYIWVSSSGCVSCINDSFGFGSIFNDQILTTSILILSVDDSASVYPFGTQLSAKVYALSDGNATIELDAIWPAGSPSGTAKVNYMILNPR